VTLDKGMINHEGKTRFQYDKKSSLLQIFIMDVHCLLNEVLNSLMLLTCREEAWIIVKGPVHASRNVRSL
jgi:hypothetical protein